MSRRRTALTIALLALVPAGCRIFRPIDPNAPDPAPAPSGVAAAPEEAAAPAQARPAAQPAAARREVAKLADANIVAMVLALNNTDISYGRLVPSRAERQDIKEFGQRMLTDHAGVNTLVNELAAKLELAPEDNIASLDLRDESAANRDEMRDLTGYAFDSTYIENEVLYHRKFLTYLDEVMIPAARNAELRTLLTNVRPAVSAHLAHAEQVLANVLAKK
jgi:putative membrane protein